MRIAVLLAATALSLPAQILHPAPPDIMVKFQSAREFFDSVWKKVFALYGKPYVQPKYAEFSTSPGPCGGRGPAYYCVPQDTIYYNRAELVTIQDAAAARLHTDGDYAALIVLAHELGHAVAHRLGDLEIFADRRENAADCMAGAATREAANAKALEAGDFEEAIFSMNMAGQRGFRSPLFDQETHGAPEERVLNFREGYEKGWRTCGLLELRMQQLPSARRQERH
jgi:predicted metalloprotease